MTKEKSLKAGNSVSSFGKEIDSFTKHIDAIGHALVVLVYAAQKMSEGYREDLTKFEEQHCEIDQSEDQRSVKVPHAHFRAWNSKFRNYERFSVAGSLLPKSLLVSMVSQYDAYLGRLLRIVFLRCPGILNSSEKKISFETLSQFSTIESAREYILEKEVESILRSSHSEQFRWMEQKFKIKLTVDLKTWPEFIEITERRNLFVHTGGIVSSQYLSVCKFHNCNVGEDVKEGYQLNVPQAYLEKASDCVLDIAVKLGHVLWRKLFPDEREDADGHIQRITYDLIDNRRYPLAISLLDFATTVLKNHSSEARFLALTVNRAQAYKWNGNAKRCMSILREIDWSAKGDEFRLAESVLAEDWSRAAQLVKRIGRDGPVSKQEYRDWPLFRDFHPRVEFLESYKEVFGEDFTKESEIKKEKVPTKTMSPTMSGSDLTKSKIVF